MTSLFKSIRGTDTNIINLDITNFSSIPNGVTALTSDNSSALATTAYVQANCAYLSPFLNTNTAQTLTGSPSFGVQSVGNMDSIGDTIQIGNTGDTIGAVLGRTFGTTIFYIKSFLQPIARNWQLWSNGSTNVTAAGTGVSLTSVAVPCKKILSGSFVIENTATPVFFTPNFTSKPVVILTIRSTTGTEVFQTKWVTGVDTAGFYCLTTASPTLVMNWIAMGD